MLIMMASARRRFVSGMIAQLVAGPVGIDHSDIKIGLVEGEVIVPAIPDDDIGLFFRLGEDAAVVYPGVDNGSPIEVRLIFLTLFNGAVVAIEISIIAVALAGLGAQIAVGHGMAHHHHPFILFLQYFADTPRSLAFAHARADSGDGDNRFF